MLIKRFNKHFVNIAEVIGVLSIIALALALFSGVIARYVFSISIPEIEVVRKLCVTWLVFIGSALAIKDKQHLEVDIFSEYMSKASARIKDIVVWALTLFAVVILLFIGIAAFQAGLDRRELVPISFLSFRPSLTYYYAALLFGAIFMLYFHLLNAKKVFSKVERGLDDE
ncbi:TRAP transporter small permease [Alkalicoccobacillus porphyridii]|uniref:TRAP transporter small permease subunit n=1 Tax=Alkalicoccobacillus porphyridii TaxID=2597270 RepID=A0A554A0T8_9BACI|nr:TRAP transporter small permease subunit [Alkalicoccobacillus porphyridii]TSB47304.1 TRAP transporter small permease subunit [Alkalicoccobacillus porphyridii]